MIYVVGISSLRNYQKPDAVMFYMGKDSSFLTPDLVHRPNLAPSKYLADFLVNSDKTEDTWNLFCTLYREEIKSKRIQYELNLISAYSRGGKNVVVCCSCLNCTRCARQLIGEALIERGEEVYIERE